MFISAFLSALTIVAEKKSCQTNCIKMHEKGDIMAGIVSKDTPLSELTLRKYEKPYNLGKRDLVKKLCLSVGLLQPGDSRDVVVDVLHVLLEQRKKELGSETIKGLVVKNRKKYKLPVQGVASSNVRRQLKRLRELFLIEKVKNSYRITEFSNVGDTFEEKIEQFLLPSIVLRVKEYFKEIDNSFKKR